MATLADSLVSSSARRLSMRKRPDLSAERQRYQGQSYWVVKEPVGLNYFRFQEEEFAILNMLDGNISLDEIKAEFEAEFPPQKITLEELQQFIGTLHRSGLIIADVPGQGRQLKMRRDERKQKELLAALTNILAIRFKGVDPDRFMTRVYPFVRWFFSPVAVFLCMLLAFSAVALIAAEFDVFRAKLPAFHQFFSIKNAFWLWVVLGVTKILHEFGHGLSCKHFGGECHEIGVLVLVLTPCLYCNVSDSWMLPNKWHRAAIGAAGMYVEIVIASICTYIWWFSEPGLLNYLCLSTMFVCSVSTIIFNGNPLLRYDGYYILSDLVEIPNLRQKATDILSRKLGWWCLGIERPDDPFLPQRKQLFFALYSIAAAVYRWFVVMSILWFLYKIWQPYRLQVIGQIIAAMSIYGLLVMPLVQVVKFFWVPGRVEKVKKPRMFATLGLLATVFAAVAFVPLPYHVYCPLEIRPHDATTMYVDVPGQLEAIHTHAGAEVTAGDRLATLNNIDVQLQIEDLKRQRNRLQVELDDLRSVTSFTNSTAVWQIPNLEATLATLEKQLAQKRGDEESLELHVPEGISGTVMPAPELPHRKGEDGQLSNWWGTPLQPRNLGAFLEEGTPFCLIGNPAQMEAILIIDQADRDFIDQGQRVELKLEELPGDVLETEVLRISDTELKASPTRLSNKAGGELATETDPSGIERPMSTSYQARALLDNSDGLLRPGLSGTAKVHAGYRTLGQRFVRLVARTFNFEL